MEAIRRWINDRGVYVAIVALGIIGATAWGAYRYIGTDRLLATGEPTVSASGQGCGAEAKLAEVGDMSMSWLAVQDHLRRKAGTDARTELQKLKAKDGQVFVRVRVNGADKTFRVHRTEGIFEVNDPSVWTEKDESCGSGPSCEEKAGAGCTHEAGGSCAGGGIYGTAVSAD